MIQLKWVKSIIYLFSLIQCYIISLYNTNRPFYLLFDESFLYILDCDGVKGQKGKIVSVIALHRLLLYIDKLSNKIIKLEVQSEVPVPLGLKITTTDGTTRWEIKIDFNNIEICTTVLQRLESLCEHSKAKKILDFDTLLKNLFK